MTTKSKSDARGLGGFSKEIIERSNYCAEVVNKYIKIVEKLDDRVNDLELRLSRFENKEDKTNQLLMEKAQTAIDTAQEVKKEIKNLPDTHFGH